MIAIPVRPRVVDRNRGDTEPVNLEEYVDELVALGLPAMLRIDGAPGAGKTTALRYLQDSTDQSKLRVVDNPSANELSLGAFHGVFVFASSVRECPPGTIEVNIAPWTSDDVVEYMLATHPKACQSVLERIAKDPDALLLQGNPELWVVVLEEMVSNPSIETVQNAIRARYSRQDPEYLANLHSVALSLALSNEDIRPEREALCSIGSSVEVRLLRQRFVVNVLSADQLAEDLQSAEQVSYLDSCLPIDLIRLAMNCLTRPDDVRKKLERLTESDPKWHRSAAELLNAMDRHWMEALASRGMMESDRPFVLRKARLPRLSARGVSRRELWLDHADLRGSDWTGATLRGLTQLRGSNFAGACLENVRATGAKARGANFQNANLRGLVATGASLCEVNFSGADLRESKLKGARLDCAILDGTALRGACLRRASLANTDLRKARLNGADLTNSFLYRANLEGVSLVFPKLKGASLSGANLTASCFESADLQLANLTNAGLADIDWPDANLRGANFTHASFHMGSSRSGTLDGYPSEGTREGFYTDESRELGFRPPQEIRKANLAGADLRGALVDAADFYLVDLRGAKYTRDQKMHFEKCGAILD